MHLSVQKAEPSPLEPTFCVHHSHMCTHTLKHAQDRHMPQGLLSNSSLSWNSLINKYICRDERAMILLPPALEKLRSQLLNSLKPSHSHWGLWGIQKEYAQVSLGIGLGVEAKTDLALSSVPLYPTTGEASDFIRQLWKRHGVHPSRSPNALSPWTHCNTGHLGTSITRALRTNLGALIGLWLRHMNHTPMSHWNRFIKIETVDPFIHVNICSKKTKYNQMKWKMNKLCLITYSVKIHQ